ncbi:unnamed protein product [Hymenolepis diminuta]|uniref:CTNNB1_binding domain-containing protein n=1 Tax=Hymenolepis diminuta TaxID=6216 RepID=A0A0R3SET9_HYMDI|nr:unnamed protein product [Hymenolepis diminuta]
MKNKSSVSSLQWIDHHVPPYPQHFSPSKYSDTSYESSDDEPLQYDSRHSYPLQEPVLLFLKKLHVHKIGSDPKKFHHETDTDNGISISVIENNPNPYVVVAQPDHTEVYRHASHWQSGRNISDYNTDNDYDSQFPTNLPYYDAVVTSSNNAFPKHSQPSQPSLDEISELASMQINNQGRDHENDPQSQCFEGFFCSLFPKVPPCLKFYLNGTRGRILTPIVIVVQPLPWSFRKLLRWKSNNTTPKVVMWALMRSHFQSSDRRRFLILS